MSLTYPTGRFSHHNDFPPFREQQWTRSQVGKGYVLSIWISRIGSGNYANFPQLDGVSSGKILLPVVIEIKKTFASVTTVVPWILSTRSLCFTRLDAGPINF